MHHGVCWFQRRRCKCYNTNCSSLRLKERRVLLAHVASRHRGAFLVHTEHGSECGLFDGSVGLHHNTGKGKLNRENRTCDTGVNISSACHVVPPPCWKKGVECTLPPSLNVVRTPMVAEFSLHCIGLDIVAHSPPRIKYFLLFLSFLINSAPPTPLFAVTRGQNMNVAHQVRCRRLLVLRPL